jgi:cold shock CspA family protein
METTIISGKEVELGTVVWFNPQKRFGFAKDQTGKEIFFHFNDGRFVEIEAGKIVFGKATRSFTIKGVVPSIPLPDPITGEFILFVRSVGSKGRPKASPWCSDFDYLSTKMTLEVEADHCCDEEEDEWEQNNLFEVKLPDGRTGVQVVDYHESNLGGDPGEFIIYE